MRFIILLLCIIVSCCVNAQKTIHYTGTAEGGLLIGSKGTSSFVFTTQGIQYRRYTFGIGSGIDFYGFSSIPLFADVKRRFTNKSTQPFVEAGAGINFINSNSQSAKDQYKYVQGNFDNGFFARGAAGLLFRAKKKVHISLSAGYQYKTASYSYKNIPDNGWGWQWQPISDKYHFNRWYIGAGIVW